MIRYIILPIISLGICTASALNNNPKSDTYTYECPSHLREDYYDKPCPTNSGDKGLPFEGVYFQHTHHNWLTCTYVQKENDEVTQREFCYLRMASGSNMGNCTFKEPDDWKSGDCKGTPTGCEITCTTK